MGTRLFDLFDGTALLLLAMAAAAWWIAYLNWGMQQ
jgi:hypothetical protein